MEELKSKFTSKTKAIIYNNPNNPLGKVFTRSEITDISQLCIDNDVLMISDEVYEHMLFDANKMIRWVGLLLSNSVKYLCPGWPSCLGCTTGPSPSAPRGRRSPSPGGSLAGRTTSCHHRCNDPCATG